MKVILQWKLLLFIFIFSAVLEAKNLGIKEKGAHLYCTVGFTGHEPQKGKIFTTTSRDFDPKWNQTFTL